MKKRNHNRIYTDNIVIHEKKCNIFKKEPFIAISNDELGEEAGENVTCPNCGKQHKIEYGKKKNKKGEWEHSEESGFVKCGEKSFLVTIKNKLI